jgi:uncharacterized protein DUF6064
MIPFDSVAFFANLAQYNEAIWPAQAVAFALGLVALVLLFARTAWSSMLIAALLAASWLWMGAVYHLQHFATINFLAPILGLAFILQGLLFIWTGLIRRRVTFGFAPGVAAWTGLALAVFAIAGYPALAWGLGHGWPELPAFGVAPCPTGIFTFAMLLTTLGRSPVHLAIIPLLWALISGTAAYFLDMPLDIVMPVIGLGALALIVWKNRAQS